MPGASLPFPQTQTGFLAKETILVTIEVATPVDMRSSHYSEPVAGTRWTGCHTDAMWRESAAELLQERLTQELAASKLFLPPQAEPPASDRWILSSEIHAFCSQVVGFVIARAAGIVSVKFSLIWKGKIIWEKTIEHVVTDADPEYSGSQVTFIEQAMLVTIADSLRLVLRDLLQEIERNQAGFRGPGDPNSKG